MQNKQIIFKSRPTNGRLEDCFEVRSYPIAPAGNGQVTIRNILVSVDPYQRLRMNDAPSYMPPQPLGQTMQSTSVGRVVDSNSDQLSVGDIVVGMGGWQEYYQGPPNGFRAVEGEQIPMAAHLGVLGLTGFTAWYGVNKILNLEQGMTAVVSAAAGAVGSAAGQLLAQAGVRVIGIAGGAEKCSYVMDELGFHDCVDYKQEAFFDRFAAAVGGEGIDGVFENVGGWILDASMALMNPQARVALCGLIGGGYNARPIPIGNAQHFLTSRINMQGFIATDHFDLWPQAISELTQKLIAGQIRERTQIMEGLENAPRALGNVLNGGNLGKQLVRV
jgi:hypothetical protein